MSRTEDVVIDVHGLCKSFAGQQVHRQLKLQVKRGEFLSIIGGSGSGKSVLLHQIIGLIQPDAGSIRILGAAIDELDGKAARRLRQRWGVLFQNNALFSAFNVFENIAFPLHELRKEGWRISERMVRESVALKLHMVGLAAEDAWKHPAELSGGMQKRVALARALMLEAELLFLDEPTTGLDPASAAEFDALLGMLQKELNLTVMMMTHDLYSVAALSDRVAALDEGRLIAIGTLAEVARFDHPFIRDFFRARRDEDTLRDLPDY
ncbi:MAG TPA: ATP-binding cassette domain-containing protein [Salinisphaeraceae bacterium]|nr:ATP-binding cassette domain-containing protein [Salinisphaeraceae bacterium]